MRAPGSQGAKSWSAADTTNAVAAGFGVSAHVAVVDVDDHARAPLGIALPAIDPR